MGGSWKTLLVSSLALGATAYDLVPEMRMQHALDRFTSSFVSSYARQYNSTGLEYWEREIKSLFIEEMKYARDATGNGRCCPPGTINDGKGCVFPESDVCPKGARLVGKYCVREPKCPVGLKFDGKHCSDGKGPQCPEDTHPENGRCVSHVPPKCPTGDYDYNPTIRKCVSKRGPTCPPTFSLTGDKCVSNKDPKCPSPLHYDEGDCITPTGPTCPDGKSKPDRDGRCIGGNPTCDDGYEFEDGLCYHKDKPSCGPDAKLVGDHCEAKGVVKCKDGTLKDGQCVGKMVCEKTYELNKDSGQCEKKTKAGCEGDGVVRHDEKTGTWACCAKGLEYYNGRCRGPTDGSKCPKGSSELINGWCYYISDKIKCPGKMAFNAKNQRCEETVRPTCPNGRMENGKCIIEGDIQCPPKFNLVGGKCVRETKPTCSDGSQPFHGRCVSIGDPKCPKGFNLENGQCIVYGEAKCTGNFYFSEGRCVHPGPPLCDPPTYLHNGRCIGPKPPICLPGERLESGKCLSTKIPKCEGKYWMVDGQCVLKGFQPECPYPLTPSDGKCVGSLNCPPNHRLIGTECIAEKKPECKEKGMVFDEETEQCVAGPPTCEEGTELVNNKCKSKIITPECPVGHKLNEETGKCDAIKPPDCPSNSRLENGRCVIIDDPKCPSKTHLDKASGACVSDDPPKCGPNLEPEGNSCVSPRPPTCAGDMTFDASLGKCVVGIKQVCFAMAVCPSIGAKALPAP